LRLSIEQKKEIVNTIIDLFNYSRTHFHDFYTLCGLFRDFYNVELPDSIRNRLSAENPGLMPPDMHLAVNDLIAGLDEMVFSTDPFAEAEPERGTPVENARKATTYLQASAKISDLEMQYLRSIASAAKYGCGVGYVALEEMQDYALNRRMPLETGTYTDFEQGQKILYPTYRPCPLLRTFPDPSLYRRNWVIYQAESSILDMLRDQEKGEETAQFKFKVEDILKTSFPVGDANLYFPQAQDYKSSFVKYYNKPVELLHFRGWLPLKRPDGRPKFVDVIATVANRQELVQFDLNEWHYPAVDSFIFTYLLPTDEEQIYPVGKVEAGMDLLLQQFYIRNQRLMNLEHSLNRSYVTDDEKFPDYITAESGKVYKKTKGSDFEPLQLGDITNKSFVEVDVLKDELRYIFASNQYSAGEDPRRKETAYGISVLNQGTRRQVGFEKKMVIGTGLRKVLERYLEIGQLYADRMPLKMFDTGEMELIGKEEIFGKFSLQLKTIEPWKRPIQRQELLQAISIYNRDPDIDQIELKRRHFEAMEFSDPEKIVPDPANKIADIQRENQLMVQRGVLIPPLPHEDHRLHIQYHMQWADNPIVAQHIQLTVALYQQQQQGGGTTRSPGGIHLPQTEPHQLMGLSQRLEGGRLPALTGGEG
jgi:hypothetical protein